MDPLCYINLTFIKRPFAKLYYINLLGTFVGLAFCIQARFSHVKSKNKQTTITFVGLAFCIQARFSHVKSKNKQTTI